VEKADKSRLQPEVIPKDIINPSRLAGTPKRNLNHRLHRLHRFKKNYKK
jgi:hypothetical protein